MFKINDNKTKTNESLESQYKNGVSWFYWIAGLSLINSLVVFFDGDWSFIAGLGVTQLIDSFAFVFSDIFGQKLIYIGFAINLIIIGIFFILGKIATSKRIKDVILFGIVFYSVDTLIFIYFTDYISILFHLYAIYSMVKAFIACKELNKIEHASKETLDEDSFGYISE